MQVATTPIDSGYSMKHKYTEGRKELKFGATSRGQFGPLYEFCESAEKKSQRDLEGCQFVSQSLCYCAFSHHMLCRC